MPRNSALYVGWGCFTSGYFVVLYEEVISQQNQMPLLGRLVDERSEPGQGV